MMCWLGLAERKGQPPPGIISDELRARIEPLLPVAPRRAGHPGRRRPDDRTVLLKAAGALDWASAITLCSGTAITLVSRWPG
jgi:hypothetical protein